MFKFLLLLIILTGCSSKIHDDVITNSDRTISDQIIGTYGEEIEQSDSGTIKSRGYKYNIPSNVTMHWNDYFFIEGNECIYSDYVIVEVGYVDYEGDLMGLLLGSNCYDKSAQGPAIDVKISDFPIKDNARLHVYDLLKVYYKFPEEFTPTDYLDYINYAVEIEKME